MNLTSRTVQIRYAAKWGGLNLVWFLTALGTQGMDFARLGSQGSLITLAITNGVWLSHVLDMLAKTGDVDPAPPDKPPPAP